MKEFQVLFLFLTLLLLPAFVLKSNDKNKIIVAQDGSGDVLTVQAAFDKIPTRNKNRFTIYIKRGVYKERLILDSLQNFVTLIGDDPLYTILTYDNHSGKISPSGDTINTYSSASFFIYGNDFSAENITFENNAGFSAGQAVAVLAYGDKLKFKNCRFVGFQDVLFCSGPKSRQYYQNCYIEGTTDFIFGSSTAVFKNCTIKSKKNSHVTAASTPENKEFGFVFLDCKLIADPEVNKVSLGRPWRPYSNVAYIRCELGEHILPEGWNNWRNPENEKTARYAEYKNFGPGAQPEKRFDWIKQLSDTEVRKYTMKNIFNDWQLD